MARNRSQRVIKISEHVWIFPCEAERDRPNLGYIRGDKYCLAVDAGHSSSHVEDFYRALEAENLSLPDYTVLTHWHWDHTFGMHAVHGTTLARPETNRILQQWKDKMESDPDNIRRFLRSDPSIIREYAGGRPVVVTLAREEITQDRMMDLGGVIASLLLTEAPHTYDTLLIDVPEDKVLFIGDAALGEFPTWRMDYDKTEALAAAVRGTEAKTIIDGHGNPCTRAQLLWEIG